MKKIYVVIICLSILLSACSLDNSDEINEKGNLVNQETENITIGFLPLDTRPCCIDIPLEIAKIADANVIYPSSEILSNFREEPKLEAVRSWLNDTAGKCDALVISMEQLVYGGLIQARETSGDNQNREDALNVLRNIKEQYPNLPIYVSNVLMRTSTSVFKAEDEIWWEKINEYSQAVYQSEILKDAEATKQVEKFKEEIPEDVLNTFLRARKANHMLNLSCIELAKEGVIDKLRICQEDCSELGIQVVEQKELQDKVLEERFRKNCIYGKWNR